MAEPFFNSLNYSSFLPLSGFFYQVSNLIQYNARISCALAGAERRESVWCMRHVILIFTFSLPRYRQTTLFLRRFVYNSPRIAHVFHVVPYKSRCPDTGRAVFSDFEPEFSNFSGSGLALFDYFSYHFSTSGIMT